MKPSLADYERTLEKFVETVGRLEDHLLSVFLYGSMARGEAIPGWSDLDFWVFVKHATLRDKARFQETLEGLVAAAKVLNASGLPVVHAFCYYCEDEVQWLPAPLVPNLQSARSSRIVWGDDIRGRLGSTSTSRRLHRAAYFFEMRRLIFHPLTPLLSKTSLTETERGMVLNGLKYLKYIPEAACAALDVWPGELDAVTVLAGQFSDLDTDIIGRAAALRAQKASTEDVETLRALLHAALTFVEQVNDHLARHITPQVL